MMYSSKPPTPPAGSSLKAPAPSRKQWNKVDTWYSNMWAVLRGRPGRKALPFLHDQILPSARPLQGSKIPAGTPDVMTSNPFAMRSTFFLRLFFA